MTKAEAPEKLMLRPVLPMLTPTTAHGMVRTYGVMPNPDRVGLLRQYLIITDVITVPVIAPTAASTLTAAPANANSFVQGALIARTASVMPTGATAPAGYNQ